MCNEQLHGDWYEQQTKNPHFIDKMFQQMNEMDESAELCLNDYDVCSKGTFTAVSDLSVCFVFEFQKFNCGWVSLAKTMQSVGGVMYMCIYASKGTLQQ